MTGGGVYVFETCKSALVGPSHRGFAQIILVPPDGGESARAA